MAMVLLCSVFGSVVETGMVSTWLGVYIGGGLFVGCALELMCACGRVSGRIYPQRH